MKPYDLIVIRPEVGPVRVWEVRSVCLGGTKQESLIELLSLSDAPGRDTDGRHHVTTWVPEVLLRTAPLFTLAEKGDVP